MADLLRTCRRPQKGECIIADTYRLRNNKIQTQQDLWDFIASWQKESAINLFLSDGSSLGVLLNIPQ